MEAPSPDAQRVVVSQFAESPTEALDTVVSLETQVKPSELGPAEVLVRIESAAVGWVDLLMTSGQYQHMPKPPYTPGLEYAGTLVSQGPEAHVPLPSGAPVLVDGFHAGARSLGPYQHAGGFAGWAVVPARAIIPLPKALTLDQAAGLLGAYETAYHCLITRGRLQAGETVLIHGASGATGLAAVHLAKLLGARVIATGRSPTKLAALHAEGADHTLCLQFQDGVLQPFRDEVKALTGGTGVDVVYDAVGGDISLESLRCVRFGARFLIVGWAATPAVAQGKGQRGAPRANQLPTNLIMMKSLDVLGCPMAISSAQDPSSRPPRLQQILAWAEAGKLHPKVGKTFPMRAFKEAMLAKWNGEVLGITVLKPWA